MICWLIVSVAECAVAAVPEVVSADASSWLSQAMDASLLVPSHVSSSGGRRD